MGSYLRWNVAISTVHVLYMHACFGYQQQHRQRRERDHGQGPSRICIDGSGPRREVLSERPNNNPLSIIGRQQLCRQTTRRMQTMSPDHTRPLAREVAQWRSKRQHKAKNRWHAVLVWILVSADEPLTSTTKQPTPGRPRWPIIMRCAKTNQYDHALGPVSFPSYARRMNTYEKRPCTRFGRKWQRGRGWNGTSHATSVAAAVLNGFHLLKQNFFSKCLSVVPHLSI